MKKRYHLRSDGEVAYASLAERIGCVVFILALSAIWIVGLIAVIRKIF
jgi:hypothetical protein